MMPIFFSVFSKKSVGSFWRRWNMSCLLYRGAGLSPHPFSNPKDTVPYCRWTYPLRLTPISSSSRRVYLLPVRYGLPGICILFATGIQYSVLLKFSWRREAHVARVFPPDGKKLHIKSPSGSHMPSRSVASLYFTFRAHSSPIRRANNTATIAFFKGKHYYRVARPCKLKVELGSRDERFSLRGDNSVRIRGICHDLRTEPAVLCSQDTVRPLYSVNKVYVWSGDHSCA